MEQTEMADVEARTILDAMHGTVLADIHHINERIPELEADYVNDRWDETKRQIERLRVRLARREREAAALAVAIGNLPLDVSEYNINDAWRFVVQSYGDYSPSRSDWTDGDILTFVEQHHTIGLDAFKKTGN